MSYITATGGLNPATPTTQTSSIFPVVTGFVVASSLLFGTGASYQQENIKQWKHFVQPKVQFAFDSDVSTFLQNTEVGVDVRSVAQHLSNIRAVMSPSMSELAKDLGITRQALYKWLSGENQPDPGNEVSAMIITNLSKIADVFSNAGISDAKFLVKMKAFNGLSLMDLVKNNSDWHQAVRVLIDEAKAMNESAAQANFVGSKAKPTDGWKSSVSIPATGLKE